MRKVLAILARELRAYFVSPLAYSLLAFLLLVNGVFFVLILSYLNNPLAPPGRPLDLFFVTSWWMVVFVGPLLTMRLIAEERRSGSIEVLMTAPVSEGTVVAGKYLAALAFYVVLWLPTLAYAGVVSTYGEIDWGIVAAGYLGIFVVGALVLAIGLFLSAMTKSQLIAAVAAVATTFGLYVLSFFEEVVDGAAAKELFAYVGIPRHLEELARGVVDTRRLVFYATSTLFVLWLTSRALAARKWR